MLFYVNVIAYPSVFRSFTGLDAAEFECLLAHFEKAWEEHLEEAAAKQGRRRKPGGGAMPTTLRTAEDRLFFILVYLKLYPLQVVMGFLFGMSQGRANEWIHRLGIVLQKALAMVGALPARDPASAEQRFEASPIREFVIDGTERRTQRPSDDGRQTAHYSGKKKAHTLKNNLVVNRHSRTVAYLSPTVPGKTHDKALADQCGLIFPPGSVLFQDTGFQGYAPSGVLVMQPKKKPRGGELGVDEKFMNRLVSKTRVIVENVIAGVKRCRIIKDVFRNTRKGYDDTVIELACGLHNLRCTHRYA
jgi:hypothetical protein